MEKPAHKGHRSKYETYYNWMVFNRVLTNDEVVDAMLANGFYRWYGGPGQSCSEVYTWRSTSRTLITMTTYDDV